LNAIKLAPVVSALILGACSSPPVPPPPPPPPSPVSTSGQGIDLANDASDVLNELQDSRLEFVARYYRDLASRWPTLSANEARRLSALGLKIVAVWESHSRSPTHFSYSSGYYDAVMAYQQARAIGQPYGSAIYFAVDYNVPSQSLASIEEYFRGVAAGLTGEGGGVASYTVGVYGSGAVCDAIKGAGLARYCWLSNSFAWAGSTSYDGWDIMQGMPRSDLSFSQDSDEARADYGAFQVAGYGAAGYGAAGYGVATAREPTALAAAGMPRLPQPGPSLISTATASR